MTGKWITSPPEIRTELAKVFRPPQALAQLRSRDFKDAENIKDDFDPSKLLKTSEISIPAILKKDEADIDSLKTLKKTTTAT